MDVDNRTTRKNIQSIIKLSNISKISIEQIFSIFHVEDFESLSDLLNKYISTTIEAFYLQNDCASEYQMFLKLLCDVVKDDNDEYLYKLKFLLKNNIKVYKEYLKDYNKGNLSKDYKYNSLTSIVSSLNSFCSIYIDYLIKNENINEEYKIMWFLITLLKDENYVFKILENNPNLVNLKDTDNKPIFYRILEYFLSDLKDMDNETIKYFKRIIVIFLESDLLSLKNEEIIEILEMLENNKISLSIEYKRIINFIINEIERHYTIINADSRMIAVDYCGLTCPIDVHTEPFDKRKDLREIFTLSIDSVNKEVNDKFLVDDAFSFKKNKDGTYELIVHIPDVDYFVKKDSQTDLFMRNIGESVYVKKYKTPMLNYDIASLCSLKAGLDKYAISITLKIDMDGNVIDISFDKSLVKVNYNLSRKKADIFISENSDERLFMLSELYELAKVLRMKRGEIVGKRTKAAIIIDEVNIITDIAVAAYFKDNGIVFPYKNYLGKRNIRNVNHVSLCDEFVSKNKISEEGKNILFSIFDLNNRIFYDTVSYGNKSFNGYDIGNVGNPLREYISLESDRLIKELLIEKKNNFDYWIERIERDCIEYTETSAKIKELYYQNSKQ